MSDKGDLCFKVFGSFFDYCEECEQKLPPITQTVEMNFAQLYEINYKILKRHNPWLREPHLNNASGKTYVVEIPNKGYYRETSAGR